MVTKRLRQFKLFFKSGEMVPLMLEPGDEYAINPIRGELVINGRRGPKNEHFTHTVNLSNLSHRRYIEWDQEFEETPKPNLDTIPIEDGELRG